jgi:hypothetical protein
MKKYYEIALMQHVSGSVENDYETISFEYDYGCSYYECKKQAKEYSKHLGKIIIPNCGYKFNARESNKEFFQSKLDAGLAAVKIICYTKTDISDYEPLYYEYYRDGKVDYKVTFD